MAVFNKPSDDDHVRRLVKLFVGSISVRVEFTGPFAPHDAEIYRGDELIAVVEVKQRTCKSSDHRTYIISEKKLAALRALPAPAFLVVGWKDAWGWTPIADDYRVAQGGRDPRPGAVNDIEPMAHIPLEHFKLKGARHG